MYFRRKLGTLLLKTLILVWVLSSVDFHMDFSILIFTRHILPLSSEGSLACHTYCDTAHPFIMVFFKDPWHSHLLPNILQWLSQPILPTSVCRGWVSNNHPSACGATVLTDCATATENPVLINSKTLEDALVFTYLVSKVTTTGDCDKDTNTRISRANQSFAIWSPSPVMVTSSYEWKILR